jgi:hypothetical protein
MIEIPDTYSIPKGIMELYGGALPHVSNNKKRIGFLRDVFRVLENLFETDEYMKVSKAVISDVDIIEMYNVSDRVARNYIKDLQKLFNKFDNESYAEVKYYNYKMKIVNARKENPTDEDTEYKNRTVKFLIIDIDKIKKVIDRALIEVEDVLEKYGRFIYEYTEFSVPGRFIGTVLRKKYSKSYKFSNTKYRFGGLNRYILIITV